LDNFAISDPFFINLSSSQDFISTGVKQHGLWGHICIIDSSGIIICDPDLQLFLSLL